MRAKVSFIGGRPGASDLLTVRAVKVLGEADVVIWGQSLLSEETVREHAAAQAELMPWPPATMSDSYSVYDRAVRDDLLVARVCWGRSRALRRRARRSARGEGARAAPATRLAPWPTG